MGCPNHTAGQWSQMYRLGVSRIRPGIHRGRILALLVAATWAWPTQALDPAKSISQYPRLVWTIEAGLPQSSVQAILQSRTGHLWIGTQGGLARFDGAEFKVYDRGNTAAMASNFISCLAEDDTGTLWAGSHGGVLRIAADGEVSTLGTADGLAHSLVSSIQVARKGEVWIGTRSGLHRFRGDTLETIRFGDAESDQRVLSLASTDDGSLWIGTPNGLIRHRANGSEMFHQEDGLPSDIVGALYAADDGGLWIGTAAGIGHLQQGQWRSFTTADGLPDPVIWALLEDQDGNIWAATGSGLARWTTDDTDIGKPPRGSWTSAASAQGLPGLVRSLYEDREGRLWVGTFDAGLWRLGDGAFTTWSHWEGMVDQSVTTVLEDRDGNIWIGTLGGGLQRMSDGESHRFGAAEGLFGEQIGALAEDPGGGLWVGTFGDGLFFLDPDSNRFHHYDSTDGLSSTTVKAVLAEADGLWVGGSGGLDHFPGDRPKAGAGRLLLDGQSINALYRSISGDLWVGSLGGGLHRLRGEEITTFGTAEGLGSLIVHDIHEDSGGGLWIASRDGGLSHLFGERFQTFTSRDGLPNDTLHQILEDDSGRLWMSSERGIFWLSKSDLEKFVPGDGRQLLPERFGREDGLRGREASGGTQPAGWRGSDGRLWFATASGVAVVDPDRVRVRPAPEPVRIEELRVDDHLRRPQAVERIEAGAEKLELYYTVLSFQAPANVRFRYRLEGFETDWVAAGERRRAFYTKIPPGRYRFVVAASYDEHRWSNEPAALDLVILPHFYQTPWFYAIVIFGIGCAIATFLRWRMGLAARREKELARRVEESLAQIRVLEGMLPICSSCKSIRDDRGYWSQLETYISAHSQARFSHSLCPSCASEYLSESER